MTPQICGQRLFAMWQLVGDVSGILYLLLLTDNPADLAPKGYLAYGSSAVLWGLLVLPVDVGVCTESICGWI